MMWPIQKRILAMSFSSDILTSFKINLVTSYNIEHRKKFQKKLLHAKMEVVLYAPKEVN